MESTDSFHLHSFFSSSCCQRIIIAAHLKGIPLTFSFVDLATNDHQSEEYRTSLNPSQSVPTLVVTDGQGKKTIIRQSISILEYFEERFPSQTPLLPALSNPEERALVRDFVNIIVIDVAPVVNSRIAQRVRSLRGERDDQINFVEACFKDGFNAYEALLTQTRGETVMGNFTVGESATLADVCLVPAVDQALIYKMDLSFVPKLKQLYEHLKALPSFQAADWRKQPDTPEKYRTA